MAFVRVEAQLSSEDLLKAVEQLSSPDLEEFVRQVVALQARRRAPSLPSQETELLLRISRGVPTELQERYDELIAKRRAETLTPNEYRELLDLTEQTEQFEVERVEALADLARLRRTTLPALMSDLGLRPPDHG